jgi:signal transduction histidine kinase
MSSEPTTRKPRRPLRSLAFRLGAWYVLAFIISLVALVAFAVPTIRAAFDRANQVVLDERVERHVALLETGLPQYRAAIEHSVALGNHEAPVRIRTPNGATVYEHGDVDTARLTTERDAGVFSLEIGAPVAPWSTVLGQLRLGALLLSLGAIALAVLGGYLLTRRGLRPVRELAATARDVIRSGDLSRRVPERGGGDDLAEMSTLFNRMLERNQALVGGMRESLDNVAHDLRTPLTRLRGTAEVALRADEPAAARDALAVCIEESDHVLTALRALMDISEAETGLMRLDRAPVSLDRLAGDVLELYEQVAEDAGVSFTLTGDAQARVTGDAARLRQAIANLVDNAIKYTPQGGSVTLEVAHTATESFVRVRDSGEGIAADAIPRIWDRLYRAEPSRNRPGLGLGLSIVKAIVTAHGGTVAVESAAGAGSTFTIALPRSADASA